MINHVHFGDCRDSMRAMIAAGVRVNCIVTSPPYWGLRDYGVSPTVWDGAPDCEHEWGEIQRTAWANSVKGPASFASGKNGTSYANTTKAHGQWCQKCDAWLGCLGLEPDYRMFIAHIVEVLRLARELMADDGTLWLNLGDSYATGAGAVGVRPGGGDQGDRWAGYRGGRNGHDGKHGYGQDGKGVGPMTQPNRMPQPGLKPKDLCMIPHRVAIALQEDGWWVRSDVVWNKPNPMPESVTDRPTKSHEYIFLLAKREQYFYDAEAIKEPQEEHERTRRLREQARGLDTIYSMRRDEPHGQHAPGASGCARSVKARHDLAVLGTRNKRSVWTVTTKPFSGAHFATFPPDLIEPCILAGTSAHGHCPKCGAGWERITEKGAPDLEHQRACGGDMAGEYHGQAVKDYARTGAQNASETKARILAGMREKTTLGWRPTCKCGAGAVPGIVLDMFFGSGTTGQVAQDLGRNWIGCELNEEYGPLQEDRTRQMGMAI